MLMLSRQPLELLSWHFKSQARLENTTVAEDSLASAVQTAGLNLTLSASRALQF